GLRDRPPFDREADPDAARAEGHRKDRGGAAHARPPAYRTEQLVVEASLPGDVVLGLGEAEGERRDVLGREARIDAAEAAETLEEQHRSRQQDDRDRPLGYDEPGAEAIRARFLAAAAAFLQPRPEIRPREAQRRRGAEEQA